MTQNIIVLKAEEDFEKIISTSDTPVIVDFYADWCGPCRKLGPILEEKIKTKNFKLLKVNVDNFPNIAEKYVTSGIPLIVLFKGGKKFTDFVGFDTVALNNMIESL
jgi:thioredoxin 1